jgi:hypothetical protein
MHSYSGPLMLFLSNIDKRKHMVQKSLMVS